MAANLNPAPACFKADVWEHFGFKKKKESNDLDKSVAVCKLCGTNVKYSGNTTNLRSHLKRHHLEKFKLTEDPKQHRPRDPKQTTLDIDGGCSHKFPSASPRSQKITESIAYFICQDLRPYSVVENPGFRRMVNAMEPRYPIPTREHLTKVCIPGLYSQTRAHVKASLASAERVALTCDGWTSRTTEAYVTITAHFINEEWELVTYVLQTRDMPESHTGHNLAEHLTKAVAEWGIKEKDPVIVTDNASNMTIAAEEAAFTLHVKCYAHTLNLAAQRALKITAVARLLGRVRRIVSFFRRSTTASHMLKEKQRLLRLPEHKLMTDVVTRWNSAHDMLERFLEQQPAICATLLSSEVRKTEKDLCTLTESDVTTAEEVVSALKPMKEATQYMSKEKTPTLSVVAPLQDTLINGLKPIEGESAVIKEMKAAMAGDLQKRYIDLKATLHACSAMDPRFKSLPFLTEDERQEVYDGLIVEAARLSMQPSEILWSVDEEGTANARADDEGMASKEDEDAVDEGEQFMEGVRSQGQHPPPRNPRPSCPLAALLGERYGGGAAQTKKNTQEDEAKEQMTRYKEADLLEVKEDPLVWWKEHQYQYPLLSQLAKRYLCIPGTSVSSERVFSTAGDIITAQRSALLPEHVDQLIFLNKNLKTM
ncbi:E3 SUMO-protein ligase ZBED1-like [Carassius gibelio]|uniref:E3 SUMO-protein ligase ZBED1-like n=1 Tax=Carassius gibelio TaxID=101364 RepID=UPI0022796DDC|nr:E3 SUMO-protein ligase ZBED1-like [Carassius gibelio]